MSSQEDDPAQTQENVANKKRRGPACDKCRSKKIRCNGGPGQRCNNCIAGNHDCTYVTNAKKRYPDLARIEELETQLANMNKLLNKLHPGVDFTPALNGFVDNNSLWMVDPTNSRITKTAEESLPLPPPPISRKPDAEVEDWDPSDDDGCSHPSLLERSFKAMSIQTGPPRFLGKASRFFFFKKAFEYKQEHDGAEPNSMAEPGTQLPWKRKSPELWVQQPWIIPILQVRESPQYSFPEADLITSLVDLFFENTGSFLPLLHRITFEQQMNSGLHFTDEGFGSVMLLVCALGARFSEDPRVLQDNTDSWYSAGWKWFGQVQSTRKLISVRPPRLFDLQICCLAGLYLHQSILSQAAWGVVGHGLRIAQEMGAHRKKRYARKPTVEGELMKRAFWILIALDGALCSSFGRTCVLHDEDYDVEFPIECDDEYWLDTEGNALFQQPAEKPSKLTFFKYFLRLKRIHVFALRTVYAINRSKAALGRVGPQWEQDIVANIDSALNAWVDSVPEHLRWDPHRENLVFFNQSVSLWIGYHNLQINIHRAFIPGPSAAQSTLMSRASLAICTNAARASIHIMETQAHRLGPDSLAAPSQNALFTATVVLLLNIWGSKRHTESHRDVEEVHKAWEMLKAMQRRSFGASRYCAILSDLANVGDIPLPKTPATAYKRPRSPDSRSSPPPFAETSKEARPIASARRFQAYQQARSPATSSSSRSGSSQPSTTSTTTISSIEQCQSIVGSQPPLSGLIGEWPSSSAISTVQVDLSELSTFPSSSLPSNIAREPAPVQPELHQFPPLDPRPIFSPELGPASYPMSTPFTEFTAPNLQDFAAAPSESIGNLIDDTLAMWSFAPSGFEWDEWCTYATNMTEMAGSGMDPTNM
ncbi:fungal-specific transcription factor domain-containing protein [Cytidiella melzeri]|nr:fungal-specific transcription factor domain-containing protein [Cytidiella melzeri]